MRVVTKDTGFNPCDFSNDERNTVRNISQDKMSMSTSDKPLDVVIVGGSLAGLMHGIMIKRLGHNVRILEQHPSSSRDGEAAGITVGDQVQEFFEKYDLITEPYAVDVTATQILDSEFKTLVFRELPWKATSWSTLYHRLRANFDGYSSKYVPDPPKLPVGDGEGIFDIGKRVTNVTSSNGGVKLKFEDSITGQGGSLWADLVIAADGSKSSIRKLLCPQVQMPYAGYLTWRATIPEDTVSEETRRAYDGLFTFYELEKSYFVVYVVPGENGSVKPGERYINFVWYYNCSGDSKEFAEIMTDVDGHRHRSTLPPGKIRPEVWARQQAKGRQLLAAPVRELVEIIKVPFVTAVSDFRAPQACFLDSKLLLVGDALSLFRPHIAQSTNQSATDCLLLEKVFTGDMEISQWEKEVMQYAHMTRLQSNVFGTKRMSGYWVYLYHAFRYRVAAVAKRWGFIL
ncbi:hypothetical protein JMJ35_001503 [Cladonia borealis]|uniref:FAD-binding domain-containing protein n=1 Tax=Cladonia borealis TaxID=184061 RepID=A0AA39R884_9LECA|nr:hypothetical protein JMJ35_001503 [Cladonia borealis]